MYSSNRQWVEINSGTPELHLLWRKQRALTWHMTLSLDGCHHFSPTKTATAPPPFPPPPPPAPPVLTKWLQTSVIAAAKNPHKPHQPSPPPPPPLRWVIRGPSAQHKDTAARLSTRGAGQNGAPTDSYSAPLNDIIEIPIPLCACAEAMGSHLSS